GEGIIRYQIKEIRKGENPLELEIHHEHFPNFTLSVSLMDGNRLVTADLPFTVERELKVSVIPEKEAFLPGETAVVTVEIRDHQDNPVETEFSLSLVNEALFARYSDPSGDIVSYFQKEASRQAEMRVETSCTFSYEAQTIQVNRDILDELSRLDTARRARPVTEAEEYAPMGPKPGEGQADDYGGASKAEARSKTAKPGSKDKKALKEMAPGEPEEAEQPRRQETAGVGFWKVSVISDGSGRAAVAVPLPESISAYRITVKGCTRETLVGEASAPLIVRKIFFAELKNPSLLQAGDSIRPLCTVHNLSDYSGPVRASLTLKTGVSSDVLSLESSVKNGASLQLLFPPYRVPEAESLTMSLDVSGGGSLRDGVTYTIPVKPWGLRFADHASGSAVSDRSVSLSLPPGKSYRDRHLIISASGSLNQTLGQLVFQDSPEPVFERDPISVSFPHQEPSELLALASLIDYLEDRDRASLELGKARRLAQALVSQLTATQQDSGGWREGSGISEIEVSALAHWALVRSRDVGIRVDADVLKRSEVFLKDNYSRIGQEKEGLRAMVLHALSTGGEIDFAFVNRLYRNRNTLSAMALAYTALCLHSLERSEMAIELLALLDSKGKSTDEGQLYWEPDPDLVWVRSEAETTAMVLLAYEALKPQARQIEKGTAYLLSARGRFSFYPVKAKGMAVAALAGFYRNVKEARNDFELTVAVNGRSLRKLSVRNGAGAMVIETPESVIRDGENRVSFSIEGRGEYLFTTSLIGFSQDLRHESSDALPGIESKEYLHENLTYRGKSIGTSTMVIDELAAGSVSNVKIIFNGWTKNRYLVLEDPIPSGATVLEESIRGSHSFVRVEDGKIIFTFEPNKTLYNLSYQIANYTPGIYRILPPVLRDPFNPSEMVVGDVDELALLAPGEQSKATYIMNKEELYGLGRANFDDGNNTHALELLERLYFMDSKYQRKEVARMLLWLRSDADHYNARRLVEYFEILKENYPDLTIPFDRILTIGRAYHDMGEYERAYLVYRATVETSFFKDAPVGGALEEAGEVLGSIDFMRSLWQEYPDSAPVVEAYFALAQELYEKAPEAGSITSRPTGPRKEKPVKLTQSDMLNQAEQMLWRFMTLYRQNPLADDAAFSRVNISLDKKAYPSAVSLCKQYKQRYPKSEFQSSFQYMEALGFFSLLEYDEAISSARVIAEGEPSDENRDLALYILGQVYHAKQDPATALRYYTMVREKFPDAREAAAYFERKSISLPEVSHFKPGEQVNLE
ncbi:MAG TPA: alpha-2-macroglobulin family protein, partial [Spirochaetia bacterium]|nr:alpha-2-macroglobulin family protein [Spirochaetia bacterium]